MSKKDKKKDAKKDNGVHVTDNAPDEPGDNGNDLNVHLDAKTALEALTDEQRAELLKEMGFTQRKTREKKDKGPDPRELFHAAQARLYIQMPEIKGIVDGCDFPSSFSVTVGVDPEGLFFANLKRVRNKYGPRKDKD